MKPPASATSSLSTSRSGITSHDAVARALRAFGDPSTGHAGTLDPFATGLLIVLLRPPGDP